MTLTRYSIPNISTAINTSIPRWRALLHARGITDQAISRAGIRSAPHGWLYPIDPTLTARRLKAFPGQHGPKYQWKPSKPDGARFYDPAGDLAEHVAAAGGVLILAAGEPDVWACWSAGVFNVTCTLHGEGTIPAWLIERLHALAVRTVQLWPDCDPAGLNHARKVRAALAASGIAVEVYALPFADDSKGDLNTLLIAVGPDGFRAALDSCDVLTLPAPEVEIDSYYAAKCERKTGQANDLYERWCVEVEAAAIRTWQITPPNGKNLSRRNFSSPLREDRKPSAQWNYTAHGFKDYATGDFFNTATCADLLGLPTWDDFKADHAPARPKQSPAPDPIHYASGHVWTLTRFLLTVKDKTVDRQDLADLAAVELIHTACAMPDVVNVIQFVRLAADHGWPVDPRMVRAGLKRGANMAIYIIEPIGSKGSQTIGSKLHNAAFRFKPVAERLRALGEYLAPRMVAPRRAPATAGEIAAVLGDTSGGLDALDSVRADVLTSAADDRADHQRRAARWLAVWQGSIKHIVDGSYQSFNLEPQPLSGSKLRVALARQIIGEGVEVRRVVAQTGLSKTTALKLAQEKDLVSVPQTATIPADQVTPTMRARGIVMSESSETATIHTPNVFKRRDTLTADEQRAVREQHDRQHDRAVRQLPRPITSLEAASRRHTVHNHQADEKAAAVLAGMLVHPVPKKPRRDPLDTWLDYQWNIAPPLSPPPIDPDTGEVLAGRARWLAAFETVRGNPMFTFTAYSEPHEHEPVNSDLIEQYEPETARETEDRPRCEPARPIRSVKPLKVRQPRPDPYWDAFDRLVAVMEGDAAR